MSGDRAQRRSTRRLVYAAVVLLAVTFFLWLLVLLGTRTEYLAMLTTLLGAVSAAVQIFNNMSQRGTSTTASAGQIGAQLRGCVKDEIERLQNTLRVRRQVLRVSWRTVSSTVGAVPPDGDLDDLVEAFCRLPAQRRRLLIVGAPAAGKTVYAARFALALLNDHAAADMIPVVLRLALWQPGLGQDLGRWIHDRVKEDYAGAISMSDEENSRILPILDGVDEVGPRALPAALDELERTLGTRAPLVVVCRNDSYQAAMEAGGAEFGGSWVIELRPLDRDEIVRYLAGADDADRSWWQPVVTELETRPTSAVSVVLRNPFNAWLLRRLFPKGASPVTEQLVRDGSQLQRRLLDEFVPAAVGAEVEARPERFIRFPVRAALRWLRFLARHLVRHGKEDFAWWEIRRAIPFLLPETAVAVLAGAGYGALLLSVGQPAVGIGVGAFFGVLFGFAFCSAYLMVWHRGDQQQRRGGGGFRETADLKTRLRRLVQGGYTVALTWFLALALVAVFGDLHALWTGLGPEIFVAASLGAVVSLIVGEAIGGIAAYLLRMMTSYIVLATVRAPTPQDALARDRRSTAVCYLMFAVALGIGTGGSIAIVSTDVAFLALTSIGGGLVGGVTAVMMFFAWPPYQIRHAWLACQRRLPWRLMRFLEVSRQAGVLRQSGAHYQFRHRILLDRVGTEDQSKPT